MLHSVLKKHPGACEAYMHMNGPEMTEAVIALPKSFQLNPCASLKKEVNACLGYQAYESVCSKAGMLKDRNDQQNRWKSKR